MKEALEMELECIVHMLDKARIELKKQQNISKFGENKYSIQHKRLCTEKEANDVLNKIRNN